MNPSTIELIHHHRSVRRYLPDPVPRETIERIVTAAQHGSTSSNLQMMSVVVVTNDAKRKQIAELCRRQFIAEAPVFLVWCADLKRLDRACELRGYTQITSYVENFLRAGLDATIASQTAALAAESLGLGICYIGAIRDNLKNVIDLLALPRLVFPIFGMTVGRPADEPRIKHRLPIAAVLHWETYNQNQDEALRDYDRLMIETEFYRENQATLPSNGSNVNDYGWLEHSARLVSQPRRTNLQQVLSDQGFDLK